MNIDKRALREVAEKATPGNWRRTSSLFNGITVTPFSLCGEEVTLAHTVEKRDAEFIAAANLATMLALLDEWEADKEQIKALESRNRRLDGIIDAAEKRVAELESIATDYGLKFQKAQDALKHQALLHKSQMEAAEKLIAELDERLIEYAGIATREARRVAELEARKVNLSKLSVGEVMHMSGFSRDYAEGWCAGNDNAIHEIRTAGIKVKES
ncbi:TPA: ead/Ea22-like family protein [Salmonella enterica]|nr:ead/Ea22-like family protein [Salmonella enterica]